MLIEVTYLRKCQYQKPLQMIPNLDNAPFNTWNAWKDRPFMIAGTCSAETEE